jgi:hypothetical protein
MKRQRKCRHCRDPFLPDPRSYHLPKEGNGKPQSNQHFCSKPECQKASHQHSNRTHWKKDIKVRERNAASSCAWRQKNKSYWGQWRADHPEYVKRNREQQKRRDGSNLANTDTIRSVQCEKLDRIRFHIHLANTDATRVSWQLITDEICLFLRWRERLANTNSIAPKAPNNTQSSA